MRSDAVGVPPRASRTTLRVGACPRLDRFRRARDAAQLPWPNVLLRARDGALGVVAPSAATTMLKLFPARVTSTCADRVEVRRTLGDEDGIAPPATPA
jgi:hypothetical protein